MSFVHTPVMLEEALDALAPRAGGRYVDGTAGGGGHTRRILEAAGPQGRVLALDRDPDAVAHLLETLVPQWPGLTVRQANFTSLGPILQELGWGEVDGVLLDLGISSHQLEGSGRGFSFDRDEPLDMRMDPDQGRTAAELINRTPEKELADIIFQLGEERASRRVARALVRARGRNPIETSRQLAEVVAKALWRPGKPPRIHPATRTFQALRLAVNRELDNLADFLAEAPELLRPGGRLAVISFHSLEDRLVKRALPRRLPVDQAGPALKGLYKKPLIPGEEEVSRNPRARSAKLRAGERI